MKTLSTGRDRLIHVILSPEKKGNEEAAKLF